MEMNTQERPNSISYRMRTGKQLESAFGGLWFIAVSAFTIWELKLFANEWSISFIVLYVFLAILFPIACVVTFAMCLIRVRLTFSNDGLYFQGPYTSQKAAWQEITGFVEINGEIFMTTGQPETALKGISKKRIPLSWFTKIRRDGGWHKGDAVMTSLAAYAPRLLNMET